MDLSFRVETDPVMVTIMAIKSPRTEHPRQALYRVKTASSIRKEDTPRSPVEASQPDSPLSGGYASMRSILSLWLLWAQ